VQDSTLPPKDAQCRFAGCCCVSHEDSIPVLDTTYYSYQ
jgi:hypothetical protein